MGLVRLIVDLTKARKPQAPGPGQLSLFGGGAPGQPPTPTTAATHVEVRPVAAHTRHTTHGDVTVAAHTTHVHVAPPTPTTSPGQAAAPPHAARSTPAPAADDDDPFAAMFEPKTPEQEAAEREEADREAAEEASRPKTRAELRIEKPCLKCGGRGTLDHYHHVSGGTCFRCEGSGIEPENAPRPRRAPREKTAPKAPAAPKPRDPREVWEDDMTEAATRAGLPIRHSSIGSAVGGGAVRVEGLNVPTGFDALRKRLPNTAATKRRVSELVDHVSAAIARPGEDPTAVRAELEGYVATTPGRVPDHIKLLSIALGHYAVDKGGNSTPARELAEVRLFADFFHDIPQPKPLAKGSPMSLLAKAVVRPPGPAGRSAVGPPRPKPASGAAPGGAPADPANNPGPHGQVPPTPGQRVKFTHPTTGQETEGHIHAQGGQGATVVDGHGTTHRVPHGQYMHVHDATPAGGGEIKPSAELVKLAARKHLELGPDAPLAIYATAALLCIGGVDRVHDLKASDVRIKGSCLYVDPDKLQTDDPAVVQMVGNLQRQSPRGPLFTIHNQPMTEQGLTTYVRRFGTPQGAGPNPTPPAPMAKAVVTGPAVEDLHKASPAALILPVTHDQAPAAAWQLGEFLVEFRKGAHGVGLVTIDGPNLVVPLHEVVGNETRARDFAAEACKALREGKTPRRGLFQAVR
jgi:hypothetical protein